MYAVKSKVDYETGGKKIIQEKWPGFCMIAIRKIARGAHAGYVS